MQDLVLADRLLPLYLRRWLKKDTPPAATPPAVPAAAPTPAVEPSAAVTRTALCHVTLEVAHTERFAGIPRVIALGVVKRPCASTCGSIVTIQSVSATSLLMFGSTTLHHPTTSV